MAGEMAWAAVSFLGMSAVPFPVSAATDDACTLLSAADGARPRHCATDGMPVAPADHKACTWKAADGHSWVTLMLQSLQAFASSKSLAAMSN